MSAITKGSIVKSLKGRDQGNIFYVLSCDESSAAVANGKQRRLEAPKHKNLKHLGPTQFEDNKITAKIVEGEYITNSEIRKSLACFEMFETPVDVQQ